MRVLALAAVALAVLLAGCSKGPGGVTLEPGTDGRYHVAMTSALAFDPVEVRVPAGATVVWHNNGTQPHDVAGYEGDPPEDDFTRFSSYREPPDGLGRAMMPGDTFEHTFEERGSWTIWCHAHHEQRMKGVVHVI